MEASAVASSFSPFELPLRLILFLYQFPFQAPRMRPSLFHVTVNFTRIFEEDQFEESNASFEETLSENLSELGAVPWVWRCSAACPPKNGKMCAAEHNLAVAVWRHGGTKLGCGGATPPHAYCNP